MNAIPHAPQHFTPFAKVVTRHRVEIIPADPARSPQILDALAEEGWALKHLFFFPVQRSNLAGQDQVLPGLFCVFTRSEQIEHNSVVARGDSEMPAGVAGHTPGTRAG